MKLPAAILASGIVLLAGVNAQNATYNAQKLQPSLFTPASSPAKCSPDGTITVTQLNQAYETQYETQWRTTTYTENRPARTITTCTGSLGEGYGSSTTVTRTITTSLSCTGKPSTVTSFQNCIPVSLQWGEEMHPPAVPIIRLTVYDRVLPVMVTETEGEQTRIIPRLPIAVQSLDQDLVRQVSPQCRPASRLQLSP